ncbi:NADH:flavin oxidoreductase/NADH oxidase [Lonsdalea quercina]|uniref:2,4-dienoyl-CoA reductase n=1 Tax=Lonsdalea quercina TaxID=71657 RepID=A0A1H3XXX0_9GAMM|nr:NADH:flavin oxidoreductase/NADH oxidase [Lonsdalea quercina]SEA04100.1 2,4-dienoyl-CoA reductase [Lonsdalea quercina]
MSQLFTPSKLGALTLDNRIIIAPMCQYSAEQGFPSEWHTMHLGNLAQSGAGLLILEATAVQPEGRISPKDLGLWNDEQAAELAKQVENIRRYSPIKLGIQLAHAGRKASTAEPWKGGADVAISDGGWQTVAPSALAYADSRQPEALTMEQIHQLRADFVAAAERAEKAGFDLIELHAAHGYLLHQFLSPLSNHRSDAYGGSLENRMRLVLEVFADVREAVSIAVGVRISATDWVDGGWNVEDSVSLSKQLEALGCDYIHVSSGGLAPEQDIPVGPNYQVPLASRIHESVSIATIAVGLITEAEQAEAIIATGQADFIALARAVLFDPRWPWHAAAKLGDTIPVSPQYLRCEPHYLRGLFG